MDVKMIHLMRGFFSDQPKKGDTVLIHYEGKINDHVFCASNRNEKPSEFKIGSGELMEWLDVNILNMCIGDRCIFTIPNGSKNDKMQIPPFVFDVELFSIKNV